VVLVCIVVLSSCGSVKQNVVEKNNVVSNPPTQESSGEAKQFVLLSFDGSESLSMWQNRDFASKMNRDGKPLNFTYFISSVYFCRLIPKTSHH
jgi:hypothetical protein